MGLTIDRREGRKGGGKKRHRSLGVRQLFTGSTNRVRAEREEGTLPPFRGETLMGQDLGNELFLWNASTHITPNINKN
jgi:hypothetical protein